MLHPETECGIVVRGLALRLNEDRPTGSQAAQRVVEARVIATSSAGVAELRSGPRNFADRWNEPSLFRITPSPTGRPRARNRRDCRERRRYSARFIIGGPHETRCCGSEGAGAPCPQRRDRVWRPRRRQHGRSARSIPPTIQRQPESERGGLPFRIATARRAPPSRIGSVSARCTGI